MSELSDFLLARVAEDEAAARLPQGYEYAGPLSRVYDPARVLAECDAKRRIVKDLCELVAYDRDRFIVSPQVESLSARTLAHLALPYADHPDYDEAWRP